MLPGRELSFLLALMDAPWQAAIWPAGFALGRNTWSMPSASSYLTAVSRADPTETLEPAVQLKHLHIGRLLHLHAG